MAVFVWFEEENDSQGRDFYTVRDHAWIFPDGLEVGRVVWYYTTHQDDQDEFGYVYCVFDGLALSKGKVESIAGRSVTFTWHRHIELAEWSEGEVSWCKKSPEDYYMPAKELEMIKKQGRNCRELKEFDWEGRVPPIPPEAWAYFRFQELVVTLVDFESAVSGQRSFHFITIGGDEFTVNAEESVTLAELRYMVLQARGRSKDDTTVKILYNDGAHFVDRSASPEAPRLPKLLRCSPESRIPSKLRDVRNSITPIPPNSEGAALNSETSEALESLSAVKPTQWCS